MVSALTRALELQDPAEPGHALRVATFAEGVARRLDWPEKQIQALRLGALLHDVGKLTLSRRILEKPGPLTEDELTQIRRHPTAGAWILSAERTTWTTLPYVLYHHERWDGAGYPSAKAGSAIPLGSRLLAVADAFDAMTSPRPYRDPLTRDEALEEVDRCAGTQFDPELAEIFLDVWHDRRWWSPPRAWFEFDRARPAAPSAR
jgi:putative nucleotidyltransferase with HDIG domain